MKTNIVWNRKDLKQQGRKNLQKNYWRITGILLIVSFIMGGLYLNTTVGESVYFYQSIVKGTEQLTDSGKLPTESNHTISVVNDMIKNADEDTPLYNLAEEHYKPTKGLLAGFYNNVIGSKSFSIGITNGLNHIVLDDKISEGHIILAATLFYILIRIFIGFPLMVGQSRYMLEAGSYDNPKIGRITYPWKVRKGKNALLALTLREIYLYLWAFTIIGGFIKLYSYKMVPYIMAEHPDMKARDAIKLSRDMMNGSKWRAFVLDLSFIGWYFLSLFTFGILEWAFINPYKITTEAELYKVLRNEPEVLFTENYPLQENPTPNLMKLDYSRHYTIWSLILLFFTFSFIGWCWEVSIHLYHDGVFVNRGTMHGPWLPIYGAGGVMMVVLLKRFAHKPALTFISSVVLAGIVEYSTATYLWETKHAKWWDYSGYFLNLNGRICAEGLLLFGIGGMAFIYVLAPFFDNMYKKIPKNLTIGMCLVLLAAFTSDMIYSHFNPNMGKGITSYGTAKQIEQTERIDHFEKLDT